MKKDSLESLIATMNRKLNDLIEMYDYNLQNTEVISYSQKLDKVIDAYIKTTAQPQKGYERMNPMGLHGRETVLVGSALPK